MNINEQSHPKKVWGTPQLTIYGAIEKITSATNKDWGGSDGLTFQQQPVQWTS